MIFICSWIMSLLIATPNSFPMAASLLVSARIEVVRWGPAKEAGATAFLGGGVQLLLELVGLKCLVKKLVPLLLGNALVKGVGILGLGLFQAGRELLEDEHDGSLSASHRSNENILPRADGDYARVVVKLPGLLRIRGVEVTEVGEVVGAPEADHALEEVLT
eukprot:CAMPEP_0168611614 /NCGR_PEP_ID=MMETSP0449_2-20121227/2456_1 /TAXON_ID=1082188 /ORGANISM="Strombidium rassoulzadegani, Strain ras09" /LENGTH=161 /DNA_ID=CAMNT_0008652081 /DNA_START=702 /DNA_END=1183 /DNA_ORIENTATION=+